jgi:hypothetical protein
MSEGASQGGKGKFHKVIGAGIGWVVGGPVGAALGLLVGHTVENNPDLLGDRLSGKGLKPQYDVLGVPYDAGEEEVKASYKKLVRKYHPDRFVDKDPVVEELARGKMTEINTAYASLMEAFRAKQQ